jgi:hypothetical protein
MTALAALDLLLLVAMFACVRWAFGWRALVIALVFWATNYPAKLSWTAGAFLRHDWLALSVAALCLLRRGYPALAGFALTWSALLRVFPALLFAGVMVNAVRESIRERTLLPSASHRRLAVGAGLCLVLLVPAATAASGGVGAWGDWLAKIRLHLETPSSNTMGLSVVASYTSTTRSRDLEDRRLRDPYRRWREARKGVFNSRRPVFWSLVAGFLALFIVAVRARGREDWVAATLGVALVPVCVEVSCYYHAILLALGLLHERSRGAGVALCGYSALSWAIVALWPRYDEHYTWLSAAAVLLALWFAGRFAVGRLRRRSSSPLTPRTRTRTVPDAPPSTPRSSDAAPSDTRTA